MNGLRVSVPDEVRSRLRATVATIEREIARLPGQVPDDGQSRPSDLLASWHDLVEQLALGPEPELRECPVCGRIGMRTATLCGFCWTKLTPLPHPGARPSGTKGYDIGGEG